MNERIKELAEQATETVRCGLNGTSIAESFNRKKFAMLIIQECIGALDDADGSVHHSECLLEHFGVEE